MNLFVSALLIVASSIGSYNLGQLVQVVLFAEEPQQYISTTFGGGDHDQQQQQQQQQGDNNDNNNVRSSSRSSSHQALLLEKLVQERLTTPPSLPIIFGKTTNNDDISQQKHKQQQQQAAILARDKIQKELLVHPVLLAHEESEVVAILCNGCSGSSSDSSDALLLSEVRRHQTIQTTIVLDDPQSINEWQNTKQQQTEQQQKLGNHTTATTTTTTTTTGLDVIIVDGLSSLPLISRSTEEEEEEEDANNETNDGSTARLSSSLANLFFSQLQKGNNNNNNTDGILAIRLEHRRDLLPTASTLANAGFGRIIDYSISRSSNNNNNIGNNNDGVVLVAFINNVVAPWHLNEAHWNLKMKRRMTKTDEESSSSLSSLIHFDAATMITLEYPSKRSAKEYCLQNEKCRRATSNQDDYNDLLNYDDDKFHHGFNPHTYNVPKDGLMVGKSTAGENAGRGVFVNTNGGEEDDNIVPPHSFLNLEVTAHPVRAHWTTTEIIVDMDEEHDIYADFNDILSYLDGYGYIDQPWGEPQYTVESGILTFVNHGCNGTFNIGLETNFTELSVDLDNIPSREDLKLNAYDHMATYDPIEERQILLHQITVQTHRHETLYKGDELFDNYLGYGGMEYLELNVKTLREECSGAVGFVEQEQNKAKGEEDEQQRQQEQLQVAEEEESSMNDDDDEEDDDDNVIRTTESSGGENNNSDDFAAPVPTAPATTTLQEDDKDESSSTTSEPLCAVEDSNGVGKTG